MTMKRLLAVGLFGAAILSATPASADSLTLTGLGKGEVVSVTLKGVKVSGWAGEGNWLLSTAGFTSNIYSYCVDLFDEATTVQNPTEVKTTNQQNSDTTANIAVGDLTAGARAAWLFNTYSDTIHSVGTAAQAAGLQLAIWETLYPALYGNALTGFTFTASKAATDAAAYYIGTLGTNTSVAKFLDATGKGQDQITRVPEPATVLLCLLALPLLFFFRRRRVAA
jgi:hypothetical protein